MGTEKYYDITGTLTQDVTLRIVAENEEEARSEFDSCDLCPESTNDIIVLSSNQCGSTIEEVICVNEEKWDEMGAAEKITHLVDCSVDENEALEWVHDEDRYWNCIEDYLCEIEVD